MPGLLAYLAVKGVAEHGNFGGTIKTNHSLHPKKHLETTMKDWPAGSQFVLETNYEDILVLEIVAINTTRGRKVVCFIAKE
jgi:hypothetical protein